MKVVPLDSIIFLVDYIYNYYFQVQNEVQNMHRHSFHINILVHITYQNNLDFDQCDENSKIIIEYHLYVLDDYKHDSEFVQHCFKLHWRYNIFD